MNAIPGLDDYLLDLLSGDAPAPVVSHSEKPATVAAPSASANEPADPPFVFVDHVPAVAEAPKSAGVEAVSVADDVPAVAEALAPVAPVIDATDALLAEFDSEFPDQAPVAATVDHTDSLLAEFDSEFPEQAPAAVVADHTDSLLAEFDSEFPEQAPVAVVVDHTDSLLAEFDAEFPEQADAPADTGTQAAFAAAMAEESAAEQAKLAPRAPTVMPVAPLPAYAKPVFDLLQKQVQEQAAQSPHGHDRRRASDRASRWLRMRCDEQHYALELLKVQEVVLPAILLPLRGAARHMLGVMNLRGQVVPVIDLGVYLGRDPIGDDALTRIVVLEEQGEILGLRVSAVEDVTTLTEQQIEPPDNTRMCRITHPLFRGVARLAQRTVILLDASELLH